MWGFRAYLILFAVSLAPAPLSPSCYFAPLPRSPLPLCSVVFPMPLPWRLPQSYCSFLSFLALIMSILAKLPFGCPVHTGRAVLVLNLTSVATRVWVHLESATRDISFYVRTAATVQVFFWDLLESHQVQWAWSSWVGSIALKILEPTDLQRNQTC